MVRGCLGRALLVFLDVMIFHVSDKAPPPVVLTGVSPSSIGAATAIAIASQGPSTLILASRTASKLDAVAADVKQQYPSVTLRTVTLDLASLDSVKAAAAQIDSLVDHVDGASLRCSRTSHFPCISSAAAMESSVHNAFLTQSVSSSHQ